MLIFSRNSYREWPVLSVKVNGTIFVIGQQYSKRANQRPCWYLKRIPACSVPIYHQRASWLIHDNTSTDAHVPFCSNGPAWYPQWRFQKICVTNCRLGAPGAMPGRLSKLLIMRTSAPDINPSNRQAPLPFSWIRGIVSILCCPYFLCLFGVNQTSKI